MPVPAHAAAESLVIEHVSRRYASGVQALDDVSLTIPPGMFGLLGPNGAGKSTLMRLVATLQRPDQGRIRFGDIDVLAEPDRLRRVLGYLPQEFGLYPSMPADRTLDHFALLKGVEDHAQRRALVDELLETVNLAHVRTRATGTFSGGMRQRLGIAIALAGRPRLLIVDEPTAGLDPAERNRFLDLLASVGERVVVLLSTHLVEEVRQLCSHMAIIDRGRVVATGSPAALVDAVRGRIWQRTVPRAAVAALTSRHRVISSRLVAGEALLHVHAERPPDDGFLPVEPSLEDVYFHRLAESGSSPLAGGGDIPHLGESAFIS